MAKNLDTKFANDHGIPVEALRHGLPLIIRDSPDGEVRGGNFIRVATAEGLALALAQRPAGSDALQVYVVPYISPKDAQDIEAMMAEPPHGVVGGAAAAAPFVILNEAMAEPPHGVVGGAAAAAPFVILNERVLQAKVLAMMTVRGEVDDINMKMKEVRSNKKAPFYISNTTVLDHGLPAGIHLKPLKMAYFAARVRAGHFTIAKATLKCADLAMYKSLFKSFPLTEMEERKHFQDLAAEFQQQYPKYNSLPLDEIAHQLVGLLAFLDLHDKKRFLTPADLSGVSNDKTKILKLLKKQRQRFRDVGDKQSLIGADFVDSQKIRGGTADSSEGSEAKKAS